ncbi:MAG: glutamate racemase [Rhodoferax sp.]|uniref:glutamate racemase n=1 Tax=Rhodoferax sp. TaxID=50421 RepID=UPI002731D08B|nr:glutamate racemase [Rhodoferax sp.]MDP1531789.1 glutamate racemase [Rhodoferax sp.]MDP1944345.1 glutamate racemase [Rhodoferax sp.]
MPEAANAKPPIGVFDSGVGGLSILKALRAELPHENFIYVADSGFAPYGERDQGFVLARARAITRHLLKSPDLAIQTLVVACNTATAAAIQLLRQDHPELPIIGVEPALKPAMTLSHTGHIGVMATRGTLNSQKFKTLLAGLAGGPAQFICQPCDGLADAIERHDTEQTTALCTQYTQALGRFGTQPGDIDTLVLGCTHYPFARETLQALVGSNVHLLDNGAPVARQTRRMLASFAPESAPGQCLLFSTGDPELLHNAAQRWLGLDVMVQGLRI